MSVGPPVPEDPFFYPGVPDNENGYNLICLIIIMDYLNNTGAGYPLPPLPVLDQLPSIEPLPDPFIWANGSGRSTNFTDWSRRRSEIKAQIENYEIGPKPNRPDTISATWIPGATPATGSCYRKRTNAHPEF